MSGKIPPAMPWLVDQEAQAELARFRSALEKIASAQPPGGDCTCGHVAWACHKRNANIYCGGVTSWAVWTARAALEPDPLTQSGGTT